MSSRVLRRWDQRLEPRVVADRREVLVRPWRSRRARARSRSPPRDARTRRRRGPGGSRSRRGCRARGRCRGSPPAPPARLRRRPRSPSPRGAGRTRGAPRPASPARPGRGVRRTRAASSRPRRRRRRGALSGSRTNTNVPAGASIVSPETVNVARPEETKYSSSWRSAPGPVSSCSRTSSSPAVSARQAFAAERVHVQLAPDRDGHAAVPALGCREGFVQVECGVRGDRHDRFLL